MASLFEVGISALNANQRALTTVGHNIANVNTPGFSRQRVEFVQRTGQNDGDGFLGKGVNVASIERLFDRFLSDQVRTGTTNAGRAEAFYAFTAQVNGLLADPEAGLSPALSDFFNGLQDVSADPASIPARQTFLDEADTLAARYNAMSLRFAALDDGVNDAIVDAVQEVNGLAEAIAVINKEIVSLTAKGNGAPPNDLLDRRDQLVKEIAGRIGVTVSTQGDGSLVVAVGNGQAIVAGGLSFALGTGVDPLDPRRLQVTYDVGGNNVSISGQLAGGELGALDDFRSDVLDPARNALGRTAVALAQTFNARHAEGMDLAGNLGGSVFSVPTPDVAAQMGNTGAIAVAFDPAAVSALTIADYTLRQNGATLELQNLATGATQTLAGAGPFAVDGLTITLTTAPAAGDLWRIRPMRLAAADIAVTLNDPAALAVAAPIRSSAAAANTGTARISAGTVTNVADPALLTTVSLVFDSPTTFRVNGAGPSIAFTSGADIDLNGWRVQVTGSPNTGDTFTVQSNAGGRSDNRNALALASLQSADLLEGGTATLQDAYGTLVSRAGSQTRQAEIARDAMGSVLQAAVEAQQSVSGVNLDEEAANLLRFQQAYQASAQVIAAADVLLQTLIEVLRS